jgi:hypothetical protein
VNAVKCELAETFIKRPDLRELIVQDPQGADIKASLQLKNVAVDYKSAGGGAAIPILGIEFGPSVSAGLSDTTGQSFDIDFAYNVEPATKPPEYCSSVAVARVAADPQLAEFAVIKGDPFITMLEGIQKQYQLLGAGVPKVKLNSLAYTSSFTVESDVSGGLGAKFIIFSLSTKAGRKTADSQALKMTFGLNFQELIM